MRHSLVLSSLAMLLLACACGPPDDRAADSASTASGAQATTQSASESAKTYSVADFRQLRWLDGRWRGTLPDGGHFYEQYRVVDDSTIAMHAFADSTFARATDSARVSLRAGVIANDGSGARWVAARLDSTSVGFVPVRGAPNSFEWVRESPDRWTAMLHGTDRTGRAQHTVYPMERVR